MASMPKKTFEQWMNEVDYAVEQEVGCDTRDLPDCCYRDWYDEGATPLQAAKRAIKRAKE